MGWHSTGNIRSLVSTMLVVLLSLTGIIAAAETNVCRVSANPSGFDHQQLTLEGIVAGPEEKHFTERPQRHDVSIEKSRWLRRRHCLCSRTRNREQW
jgi:hypothetical protein